MITIDFKQLTMGGGCRMLDIGCGSGRHTAAAYDRSKGLVVGADPNTADLSQARDRLRLHESNGGTGRWALAGADITRLPFGDQCFDAVVCSEVLEHVHDHVRAIREILRVLKDGGRLAVSVPRQWPETICWALSREYRNTEGGHIRIYSRRGLIHLIRSCGAVHHHTHFAHGLHTPYWWLKCLLGPEREKLWPVELYHRLLTWDMLKQPPLTRLLDRCLNPLCGKSVVLYFLKSGPPVDPRSASRA